MFNEAVLAINFLLKNLELLIGHSSETDTALFFCLSDNLQFVITTFKRIEETGYEDETIWLFLARIRDVVYEAVNETDSFLSTFVSQSWQVGDLFQQFPRLNFLMDESESFKKDVMGPLAHGESSSTTFSPRERMQQRFEEDLMVGFDDEAMELLKVLTGEGKQLQVIPIVGMAGIGKTTLAKRLFNHSFVQYHFHIRAWTTISQRYQKANLLHDILGYVDENRNNMCDSKSDLQMGDSLFKSLKGKRYLIVIDDIWDAGVWRDINMYFPNDNNRSRILMTTRIKDLALNIRPSGSPHCLRFLNLNEACNLFEHRVFGKESCPQELLDLRNDIVAKCKGLPLVIVVVAGVLSKKDKTKEVWKHAAENICWEGDLDQLDKILALSYEELPCFLKPCFLYFAEFPEDYEIPVRRLIWSWIAEGFIQETGRKELEGLAENYLIELVQRSLVIIAKERSDGGIKTCHIHDTLRDFCLRYSKRRKLFQPLHLYKRNGHSFLSKNSATQLPCFHAHNFHYGNQCGPHISIGESSHLQYCIYKFIMVLNLEYVRSKQFPVQVFELVHLKYLALRVSFIKSIPSSICKLKDLETFILHCHELHRTITLPKSIWTLENLRHLLVLPLVDFPIPAPNISLLENLQTVTELGLSESTLHVLAKFPNLRKLRLSLLSYQRVRNIFDPNLSSLSHLQTLRLWGEPASPLRIPSHPTKFPQYLKKLTLSGSAINWKEMWIVGLLPNLEILKLKYDISEVLQWETSDGGFHRLKSLRLSAVRLERWISFGSHFPILHRLTIHQCKYLKKIPSSLGDISTLQKIEVYHSSRAAAMSAKKIHELQQSMGNNDLDVLVYPNLEDQLLI